MRSQRPSCLWQPKAVGNILRQALSQRCTFESYVERGSRHLLGHWRVHTNSSQLIAPSSAALLGAMSCLAVFFTPLPQTGCLSA
jgi:hypothetical protein